MGRHFEYLNHKPACAHTLKEGFDLLNASLFDMVILNVRLPDGDGFSASKGPPLTIDIHGLSSYAGNPAPAE